MEIIKWPDAVPIPPRHNMARFGEEHLRKQASEISTAVNRVVAGLSLPEGFFAFDFGAGIGRTAIPLYYAKGYPQYCSDVDRKCVDYLRSAFPEEVKVYHAKQSDPLPFNDGEVDLVISVSVFTHLPEDTQHFYLSEIKRILKAGGFALLSKSSFTALKSRKKKGVKGWEKVTEEEFEEQGFIYMPIHGSKDESYGYALHSDEYVKVKWSEYLRVEEILTDYIDNVQDLVILANGYGS